MDRKPLFMTGVDGGKGAEQSGYMLNRFISETKSGTPAASTGSRKLKSMQHFFMQV